MSHADLADFTAKDKSTVRPAEAGLVASALSSGLVLAMLAFVVPEFEAVFGGFGISLGGLMMVFVRASHSSLALAGVVVILLVADSIVRDTLARRGDRRELARAWSTLMIGLPMITVATMIVAIGATMIGFLHKLSG